MDDDVRSLPWVVGTKVLVGPDGDLTSDQVAPVEAVFVRTTLYGEEVVAPGLVMEVTPEDVGRVIVMFPGSAGFPIIATLTEDEWC